MKQLGQFVGILVLLAGLGFAFYQFDPEIHFRTDLALGAGTAQEPGNAVDSVNVEASVLPTKPKTSLKPHPPQGKWAKLDAYALGTPAKFTRDVPTLTAYLIKPAKTEMEKARVLFRWITANIQYDDDGYNSGQYGHDNAEEVLKVRNGVCDDFSELYMAMAKSAGLEAEKVSGYAKGYGYVEGKKFEKTDHAWNALKIDGKWHLFDATWAQGYGEDDRGRLKSVKHFDEEWFDADPRTFIYKHLPEEAKWQLLPKPITKMEYEKMPYASPEFFSLGIDANQALSLARSGKITAFPLAYADLPELTAINLPINGNIAAEVPLYLSFECPKCTDMMLMNRSGMQYFTQQGTRFAITITPVAGEMILYFRTSKKDSFSGFLNYKVIKSKPSVGQRPS
jgi:hypothetical protein